MGKFSRGALPLRRIFAAGGAVAALGIAAPLAIGSAPATARTAAPASVDGEIADFYRARGGAPFWFAPHPGAAPPQLLPPLRPPPANPPHPPPLKYPRPPPPPEAGPPG